MSDFLDEIIEEIKAEYPEEWEQAQAEVKEYFRRVESGEERLNIRELYFDENGNLVGVCK